MVNSFVVFAINWIFIAFRSSEEYKQVKWILFWFVMSCGGNFGEQMMEVGASRGHYGKIFGEEIVYLFY